MFSRRHPYLFFTLVFTSIISFTVVTVSIIVALSLRGTSLGGMFSGEEKVGVIEITGAVREARDVLSDLKRFRKDDTVKAIVVRIDSPGGVVGPSQEIFREIRKTLGTKTVVASMGSIAASGGYYIAAGAEKIVANPGTITGSIGVIMAFTNVQELLKKIGLVPVVVKSGEFKDLGSPARDMKAAERELLEAFARKIHTQFIQDIVAARKLPVERVEKLADGRIFTGEESIAHGLIDRLGNFEDAVEWAGKLAGIKGEIKTVYASKKKSSFLEYLLMKLPIGSWLESFFSPDLRTEAVWRPHSSQGTGSLEPLIQKNSRPPHPSE